VACFCPCVTVRQNWIRAAPPPHLQRCRPHGDARVGWVVSILVGTLLLASIVLLCLFAVENAKARKSVVEHCSARNVACVQWCVLRSTCGLPDHAQHWTLV
jgi:hypothetical protein